MSLEKKDLRLKVHPEVHEAIKALAEVEDMEMAEWVEKQVVRLVRLKVHAASVISERMQRMGINGNRRECGGESGFGSL